VCHRISTKSARTTCMFVSDGRSGGEQSAPENGRLASAVGRHFTWQRPRWNTRRACRLFSPFSPLQEAPGSLGVRFAKGADVKPKHDARYWAKVTAGFDFSDADRVPPARFNRVLWDGLMSGKPYPALVGRQIADKSDD
jgi:hypothetical protein